MTAFWLLSATRSGWCCWPACSAEALVSVGALLAAPVVFSLFVALVQSVRCRLPPGYTRLALVAAFLMSGVLEFNLCQLDLRVGYFASLLLGPLASWWVTCCLGLPLVQKESIEPGLSPAGSF